MYAGVQDLAAQHVQHDDAGVAGPFPELQSVVERAARTLREVDCNHEPSERRLLACAGRRFVVQIRELRVQHAEELALARKRHVFELLQQSVGFVHRSFLLT